MNKPLNQLKPKQNRSRQGYGKLPDDTVKRIKADCEIRRKTILKLKLLSLPALAKKYGVSSHTIDNIYRGTNYKHV